MIQIRNLKLASAFMAGVIIFSGCTLNKMVKLASDQDVQVNPNPLEVHGTDVPFEMSAVLPPKMLPSGKVYTIKTIYEYNGQEVEVGSVEFKADDFPSSSSSTSRKSEEFTFQYEDGMNPGTLYVKGIASDPRSGKSKSTDKMEVAKGLVMTSRMVEPVLFGSYADHGYNDKEELVPTNVAFYFDQGSARLRSSLSVGGSSNATKTKNLNAFIAEKNVTRTVTITGTHSPEGPERINSNLAKNRAQAIESAYRRQMKRYDYKGMSDSIKFLIKPVVEDWSNFKQKLKEYNGISSAEKDQALKIVNGNGSFEDKEDELQKLPFYKKVFKDLYPELRAAKTEILTVKEKKSNAEIAVLSKQIVKGEVKADTLSNEELLFSATLTPSASEKEAIYKAATKSGTWQSHNNLAAVYLENAMKADGSKKTSLAQDAMTQLDIAWKKNESAFVKANMAAAYMLMGDYEQASSQLEEAIDLADFGDNDDKINAMKGALQVMNGDYDKAVASFAAAPESPAVTFDKGLAQLLSGSYDQAKSTLGKVAKDEQYGAKASYLVAVASARTNNAADVASSLMNAVKMDPSLKDQALNDLEFRSYADAVAKAVK